MKTFLLSVTSINAYCHVIYMSQVTSGAPQHLSTVQILVFLMFHFHFILFIARFIKQEGCALLCCLWNSLPREIRSSTTFGIFKSHLEMK